VVCTGGFLGRCSGVDPPPPQIRSVIKEMFSKLWDGVSYVSAARSVCRRHLVSGCYTRRTGQLKRLSDDAEVIRVKRFGFLSLTEVNLVIKRNKCI
jgi:hypothetical protein